jgi:hypothetical protein
VNLVHTLSHGIGVLATEAGPNNGPGAWMPELRGILTVIIGVFVLMGSVYFIMMTNMGARLAFLVAFSALAGWMFLMGAIWWTYGIGLKGAEPSWDPVPGRTVLQDPQALVSAGALDAPVEVTTDPISTATNVQEQFVAEGWAQLPSSAAAFGQASSAAETYLIDSGAFAGGDYKVVNVFDIGGERYPRLMDGKLDFVAFFHNPRHIVVEVAPVIPLRDEPGRAPSVAQVDQTLPHQYVYMERNRGSKRHPSAYITIGSLIVFTICAWLLHRRDKTVQANRSLPALPAKA